MDKVNLSISLNVKAANQRLQKTQQKESDLRNNHYIKAITGESGQMFWQSHNNYTTNPTNSFKIASEFPGFQTKNFRSTFEAVHGIGGVSNETSSFKNEN